MQSVFEQQGYTTCTQKKKFSMSKSGEAHFVYHMHVHAQHTVDWVSRLMPTNRGGNKIYTEQQPTFASTSFCYLFSFNFKIRLYLFQ